MAPRDRKGVGVSVMQEDGAGNVTCGCRGVCGPGYIWPRRPYKAFRQHLHGNGELPESGKVQGILGLFLREKPSCLGRGQAESQSISPGKLLVWTRVLGVTWENSGTPERLRGQIFDGMWEQAGSGGTGRAEGQVAAVSLASIVGWKMVPEI